MKSEISTIGNVTNKSVLKCTGKSWRQWVDLLDRAGAKSWTHQEIVKYLRQKFKPGPWWEQMVASCYEIHIGKKVPGRNSKGEYSTVATKAMNVPAKDLWKFVTSNPGLAMWLRPLSPIQIKAGQEFETEGGVFGSIRTLKAPLRIRLSWQETEWPRPSVVQVLIVDRKKGKSMLVIQHDGLMASRLKLQMRDHWKEILQTLHSELHP